MDEKTKKEKMFEAELMNQQLENMQRSFEKMEKQRAETLMLKEALSEYEKVEEGQEMLVPIANGMFIKGITTKEKTLQLNVGNNIVVPKTIPEVHSLLDDQLREIDTVQKDLQSQFERVIAKLQDVEQEFKTV